jgi:hypothetical protein
MAAKHHGSGVLGENSSGRIGAQKDDSDFLRNSAASARSAHRWSPGRPGGCRKRKENLYRDESSWNGQLSEESRGSTLVPLRLAERRSFSTGGIEPPGLSTPHKAPGKMIG